MTELITLNVSTAVRDRYSDAAKDRTADLCCAVTYDAKYLEAIPTAVLERDYGCGDPSKYVLPGDIVLDLGSGGGKICFIASQVVGPNGRVIGVDCNDDMLALARASQIDVAQKVGFSNVEFRKGQIQDLKLDLDQLDARLRSHPVTTSSDWLRMHEFATELRRGSPLIEDDSVDVVVSNCVLNLVQADDRRQLFREIFRVLKPGGRAVISDIVADRDIPPKLQNDPELWSGCLSGAFRDDQFLRAFEDAGFVGIEILVLHSEPWRVIEGIEFRSMTLRAHKRPADHQDTRQTATVTYRGPFRCVEDDAGNRFPRGQHVTVTSSDAALLQAQPYCGSFLMAGVSTDGATEACCAGAGGNASGCCQ